MVNRTKFPALFLCFSLLVLSPARAGDLNFLIQPQETISPISPYIYGTNEKPPADLKLTVRRLGGNRMTGYNWENNASNAGNDWHHFSDNWLCGENFKYADCDSPGAMVKQFVAEGQAEWLDSLITLPMAGFVSADKLGAVVETEAAPSKRWEKVSYHKKGPYGASPNLKDGVVYEDEFLGSLVRTFGKAADGGVKFYALDNEPALWPSTHPRIHPKPVGYWEMINLSEAAAVNLLRVDSTARIFGPACYGWQEFLTLQDAPDSKELNQTFGTFLDFYLAQMHDLEKRNKQRLLHVLDLHWYPEAQGGGKRITEGDLSPESIDARLQAPRSLWDPGYVEKSWITQYSTGGKAIHLIPWVREKIEQRYPGTKLAFTEYDYGAGDHVSGGLAQADVLGIFGKNGIFMSNYWGALKTYNLAAFKLYRNYDGKGSAFGDTAVSAGVEDVSLASVYAATDSKRPGILWLVVLNKSQRDAIRGKFKIEGTVRYNSFEAFGFDSKSPSLQPMKPGKIDKDHFDYSLPPLSATLIACKSE